VRYNPSVAMHYVWFVIRWLHLLAMTVFVGGQFVLALAVVPAARRSGDRAQLREVARRFGQASIGAIAVLLVTGPALASHFHLWQRSALQVKLGLVVVILVLLVGHVKRPALHVLEAAAFLCSLAVVWLGLYLANGYT
jgi:uncharacterized membrane protein